MSSDCVEDFTIGGSGLIHGLLSESGQLLNGQVGIISKLPDKSGRMVVRFDNGSTKRIKTCNVKVISETSKKELAMKQMFTIATPRIGDPIPSIEDAEQHVISTRSALEVLIKAGSNDTQALKMARKAATKAKKHLATTNQRKKLGTTNFKEMSQQTKSEYLCVQYRSCSFCGLKKNATSLSKCSRCQHAFYCNTVCQKNHWKQHKKQCTIDCKEKRLKGRLPAKKYTLEERSDALQRRGRYLLAHHKLVDAEKAFREGLALEPENYMLHICLASCMKNEPNRLQEAAVWLRKGIKIDSNRSGAYANLAEILAKLAPWNNHTLSWGKLQDVQKAHRLQHSPGDEDFLEMIDCTLKASAEDPLAAWKSDIDTATGDTYYWHVSNGQRRKRKPEQDLTDTKNFDFHVNNLINFLTGPSSVVPQQASLELAVLVKIRTLASKHPTHINVQHCLAAMQFRCMLFKDMFNQYQFVRSLAPGDGWVLANFTAKLQSGFGQKVLVEAQTKEGNKIVGFKRRALNKDGTHNVHLVQDESVVHAIKTSDVHVILGEGYSNLKNTSGKKFMKIRGE